MKIYEMKNIENIKPNNVKDEELLNNRLKTNNIDYADEIALNQENDIDNCDSNDYSKLQEILYQDDTIILTKEYIKINKYYYPFKKEKVIKLSNIKEIKIFKLTRTSGKYKFFGLNWDLSWYHLDQKRPNKDFGIKINDGSIIKPVITPINAQQVYVILNSILRKSD